MRLSAPQSPAAQPAVWVAVLLTLAMPSVALAAKRMPLTRDQMELRLEAEHWLFVYGTQDPAAQSVLRARALRVAGRLFGQDSSLVRPDHAVSDRDLESHALFVIGNPRENSVTRKLAPDLPVTFNASGFEWFGTRYDRPGDAIHLVYPNPREPRHFLLLVAGNSTAAMTRRGGGFWFGNEDWRIYREGELARSGTFAQSRRDPWKYEPARDRDRESERASFLRDLRVQHGRGVDVRSGSDVAHPARARAEAEALLARMDAYGLAGPAGEPLQLTLYSTIEAKGTLTRSTRPEHVDAHGAGHGALLSGRARYDLWSVAAARLIARGGAPDAAWLTPVSVWLADRHGGEPLARTVSRLYFGKVLPTAVQAAQASDLWQSPLIWTPARAVLAAAIHDVAGRRGARAIEALLQADRFEGLDAVCQGAGVSRADVESRFRSLADSLARTGRIQPAEGRPRPWVTADGFQSGVCLTHAVSLERGYASHACGQELAGLRAMGAGWVSITPFGYMRSVDSPQIRASAAGGVDEETDESVVEAHARAEAAGLRTWLKPHLWTRGWVGELRLSSSGWREFFLHYREFILHYALLAEREGFDGFVVGHELVTASLGHPDEWRALIGEVRRIYRGTLTYGANWGEEVQQIEFWDALDLIGVSFYQPLSETPTTSVDELTAGAQAALASLGELSRRVGKPVLLTEVGYSPMADAAVRPWEEQHGLPDLAAQHACYEAFVNALADQDWVAGAFFWKWFTSPDIGGPMDSGFTPRGKPAETVMTRAFRQWRDREVKLPGGR